MPTKVLITGIGGFAASHLAEYLLHDAAIADSNIEVHGISQQTQPVNVASFLTHPNLHLYQLDLADTPSTTALLKTVQPDYIFHLAAQSLPGRSIEAPMATLQTNLTLTLSLFEALRAAKLPQTRVLNAGSGDEYGFIQPEDLPVRETTPFRPGNPYAVSKIAQEMLGYQYFRSYGLQIVNTRAFNHNGARQNAELAASAFARQIAQAEAGQIEPVIRVGNLEARRDFTDVSDIVRAYWLAVQPELTGYAGCQPGEVYNLCSGQDYSIKEILTTLLVMAKKPLEVQTDPARLRPSDIPVIRGDYTKFHLATGWQPTVGLQQSLQNLLNYWRQIIA